MILLFIAQLLPLANTTAMAADAQIVKADMTGLRHAFTGRADKIIDGRTVLLKDGKIIRLLGLEFPLDTALEESEEPFMAKQRLENLLPDGTEVMVYQRRAQSNDTKRGRVNRMGHLLAHVVRKDNEQWINGALVADGLAWVMTDAANPELTDQLYTLENKARKSGKNIWSKESVNGLLNADTAIKGDGQYRVVEAKVLRSATAKNNLYLNFGKDWRDDFTVMLSPSLRKTLARRGTDPMSLSGKTIRVRGWIRNWNGPYMELETAERLEIVAASGPSTEQPTEPSTDAVENTADQPRTGQLNP